MWYEIGSGGVYFGYGWLGAVGCGLGTVGWVRVQSFGRGWGCGFGWLGMLGTVRTRRPTSRTRTTSADLVGVFAAGAGT